MSLIRRGIQVIRSTVRYKLLVLVLFPILLVMPIALLVAAYWGTSFSYDQLFIKVNTDLSVAHDLFRRIQQDYLGRLGRQAESYDFHVALEVRNSASIQQQLQALRQSAGFSYLHLLDPDGEWLFEPAGAARSSALLLAAFKGRPGVGIELFSRAELAQAAPGLVEQARLPLIDTPRARPGERQVEDRGMVIRAIYPVKDSRGEVVALLDGGVLLNRDFDLVDAIRDLVYGEGSLPQDSIGTVTVFLDDVRISTNVPLHPGERALGTWVSDEVRSRVLDEGRTWIDRAFVVNDWYISSYEPIVDVDGRRVGMLYAGFLETPFRLSLWRALALLVLMFVLLMLISSVVAVIGAKSIFRPLEAMSRVVRATREGRSLRIGQVASRDEIGELAREFDGMLGLLETRNREIQQWAGQLEGKVRERTAELEQKNADLQRTVRVLRQTRQQLVVAEKLAALGELTAGVAHEINNPTAVILGNMDVMVTELGAAAEPVRTEIDLIIEQIYRIRDIIDNLLQYARSNEYAGYLLAVDVNQLVQDTLKLVRHLKKEVWFELDLDLQASLPIKISPQELQQVLVNLIVNAVHALPVEGGVISISTREWENKGVVLQVTDNGCGMDEQQLGHIFNPFYSTKAEGEGSGLGLSVSYGLIRRCGGNITVRSSPGGGSCFSVWLLVEPLMVEDEATITEQLQDIEIEERSARLAV